MAENAPSSWSYDISAAPTDAPVWLATKCGKVIKSQWLDRTKFGPARWSGLATAEMPVAWTPFVVPTHPAMLRKLDAAALDAINHLGILEDAGGDT